MKKLLALMSLALVLAGCSSAPKEEVTPTPEATVETTPETEGEVTEGEVVMTEFQKKVDSVINGGTYQFPDFITADDAIILSLYNLQLENVENYAGYFPLMNTQATEIIVIEAKEGKLDVVKEAIAARMAEVEKTWEQYLPAQLELVQNRVEFENGNIVGVVIAENAQQIADDIQAALSK